MSDKIFAVPIGSEWLVHAPLHRVSALVNQSAIHHLTDDSAEDVAALRELRLALQEPPLPTPSPIRGELAPDFLGFITTRACNIDCGYCDFGGPSGDKRELDPRVAVGAIDWMAERLVAAGRKRFKVHFFGGEPFFAPDRIDLVIHRTRHVCAKHNLEPWFEVSTNGVFPESRAQWIGDYFDVVVLSFDGPREIHDRNRPAFHGRPTFDLVDRTARLLSKSPVKLCLRACVTQASVERLEEITQWMCDEYQPAVINFEPLTDNDRARRAELEAPDPYAFAIHWMRAFRLARERGIEVVYSAAEGEEPRFSSCPVGSDTLIISPDGRASGCYMMPEDWQSRGMNLDVGWFRPHGQTSLVELDLSAVETVRNVPANKPRCEECFCRWSCAGGCHVVQTPTNCSTDYNDFCRQTRIVTACLQLERLGLSDRVDRLLGDRSSLERLANAMADRLVTRDHSRQTAEA